MSTRSPLRSVHANLPRYHLSSNIHPSSIPTTMQLKIYQLMMWWDSKNVLIYLIMTKVGKYQLRSYQRLSRLWDCRRRLERFCRLCKLSRNRSRWTSKLFLRYSDLMVIIRAKVAFSSFSRYLTRKEWVLLVLMSSNRSARVWGKGFPEPKSSRWYNTQTKTKTTAYHLKSSRRW